MLCSYLFIYFTHFPHKYIYFQNLYPPPSILKVDPLTSEIKKSFFWKTTLDIILCSLKEGFDYGLCTNSHFDVMRMAEISNFVAEKVRN